MKNQTMMQFFEWYCPADGGHWRRFGEESRRLAELGITAAWLPPAYKGTRGGNSEGYDVYDIYDLGEFDQKGSIRTKYGTKQEYLDAIRQAQRNGLKVYADIVLNHMGGAEECERIKVRKVDADDRRIFVSEVMEVEAYTKFTFPGRNGKHSTFVWDHNCFTGIDYAADINENAIYSIVNDYGEHWEDLVHDEKGNFDYLILNDVETRNPAVRAELKYWGRWYYETARFDGVRIDAVKHMPPSFFVEWLDFLRSEVKDDLFAIGEYWLSDDLPVLLKYIEATGGRMSLFDAPLHHNFSVASNMKEAFDLRELYRDALVSVRPDLAVTFVDNHDTQPLQSLEEYTEQWFKPHAYAAILLRETGYPCVFYPDMYGTCYSGRNKQEEHCEVEIKRLQGLEELLLVRKERAYGRQRDYFDHPNCVGWTREGDEAIEGSGCAVLLSNEPQKTMKKRMEIGVRFAGMRFRDVLGNLKDEVEINRDGTGEFLVAPATASVWVPV